MDFSLHRTFFILAKSGPKSLVEKHPEIVEIVNEFITQNGSAAHARRRTDTQYALGVSLQQIADEVVRKVPELKSISRNTIHRLMRPPHEKHCNAKRFKSLVDAKVPPKRNDLNPKEHGDTHYCRASVSVAMQLGATYPNEVILMSSDNKMKISIGIPAVSRRVKIRKFFKTNDKPNFPDHDFPIRDSKIVPAGYKRLMFLPKRSASEERPKKRKPESNLRRSRSLSPSNTKTKDKKGREKIQWSRNGPLELFLYGQRHFNSTSTLHCRHLRECYNKWTSPFNKGPSSSHPLSAIINIVDGGPDWKPECMINVINLGRLWHDLNLDVLINVFYAACDSKMNPIERGWSYVTSLLVGVMLQLELLGNTEQLTDQQIFDAVEECAKYIRGAKYGGFSITPHCDLYDGKEEKEVHENLKDALNKVTKKKISSGDLKEFLTEYRFLMSHCVKRKYYLQFKKCTSLACHHCSTHPVRAKEFFNEITNLGGSIPPLMKSLVYEGSYASLQELRTEYRYQPLYNLKNQPSYKKGLTCQQGCNIVFFSAGEKPRHYLLMGHADEKQKKKKASKKKATKKKATEKK